MEDRTLLASQPTPDTVAELHGVQFSYPASGSRASHAVLESLNLEVRAGQHLAIVGRSGCGKSTLLSLIGGLAEPDHGHISVLGQTSPPRRLKSCALMPQGDSLLPWFTLLDNVAIGLRNRGIPRRNAREAAQHILEQWNLAHWARHRPDALSGGMRQRAALARALLVDKPILLADEPLGALDALTCAEAQEWLRKTLPDSSATLLLVTHDVDEALLLGERIVVLTPLHDDGAATLTADFPGWFSDTRAREEILADPNFGRTRLAVLRALQRHRPRPSATLGPPTRSTPPNPAPRTAQEDP